MSEVTLSYTAKPSTGGSAPAVTDDKSEHCIPFILSRLSDLNPTASGRPFIIGLNGVQGAGKTTLVSTLADTLQARGLETLVLSIDDLYLTHDDQVSLAQSQPDNALMQHRGEPGTHDIQLLNSIFDSLITGGEVAIPSYDKSLFNGAGDRAPTSTWKTVNSPGTSPIRVIILEGWLVGFHSLDPSNITSLAAKPSVTLHTYPLSSLLFVNEKLQEYEKTWYLFDAFIHIDAKELSYVYEWRQQQERRLREKEMGMTEEQVKNFVDGYFPAYEMFTEGVQAGVLKGKDGAQLRLTVGRDRKVEKVEVI
ncbi:P-loop containing nucleoside triphosphate hydrolase protein [Calycina marina]|uniref:P-loop containing nucleoside triphosphate hydrolase protein n=1 Tax=Calycina marina TaxID=1763456 RepID=A0A9P7Z0Z1_9HELO|nr:P-loop containing nucleoside triphosphate hydrolase protein [Calycina marina]